MFTAGHLLTQRRDVERCTERGEMGVSMLIERSDLFSVFDEVVLLEYFTPEITERFVEWNKCKETLYNDAMKNLGLDFRFLWLFDTPSHRKQVAEQISARDPPSREWWIENFPYVLGYDAPDVVWDGTTFCAWNSQYEKYWELIQRTHKFCVEYRGEREWQAHEQGHDFWFRSSAVFAEIKDAVSKPRTAGGTSEDVRKITLLFLGRLDRLSEEADMLPPFVNATEFPLKKGKSSTKRIVGFLRGWKVLRSLVEYYRRSIWESGVVFLFERYKLTPRLTTPGRVVYPVSGDEFLF